MKLKEFLKNIIIVVLVVGLLEVSYSKFIKKEYPVKLFGISFLIVTSGSMEPEINTGEFIIISEKENYEIGDIVTFIDNDDFLITHRIVNIHEDIMETKGDANNLFDEETTISNVKGKVIFHSKILGKFVLCFLKPLIFIYLIIVLINFMKEFFYKEESNKYEKKVENNYDS